MDFLEHSIGLFHKGGPVMYLLLLASMIVVAISIERFIYYRDMKGSAEDLGNKLRSLLERGSLREAKDFCLQSKCAVGQVAAAGLAAYEHGRNVENVLQGEAALVAARLREYLNYLSVIVTLSPLLGLLGTVIGMINSFSVLNVKAGQPLAITGGVGEALVATAAGLSVATMALIAHTYFSHVLDKVITDMEQIISVEVGYLPTKKLVRRESHEIA